MVMPPGVVGDGMMKIGLLTTFNGTLAASAVTAAIDVTCEFTADGFNRGVNEAVVNDQRLCSVQDGEEPGRYNETLENQYVWDQQNPDDYEEVLASKVLRSQDVSTDGAKVADALRKHAQVLRDQHYRETDEADDGYFGIVEAGPGRWPELAERPVGWF